jgi:hypothetical protein
MLTHWEILAICSDEWITWLKRIGIKKIKVWTRYNVVWVDMVTKESEDLRNLQDSIVSAFVKERGIEISYWQRCKSFDIAATKLGILEIKKQEKYSQEEIVESAKEYGDRNYSSTLVTFESGKTEILENIAHSNIKIWDKFNFIYADPKYKTQLQIMLLSGNWQKKQEWVSEEYIKLQKQDTTNFVEIVRG